TIDGRDPSKRASSWALSIRQRLCSRIQGNKKPDGTDIDLLVAELINAFITVVQTNRRSSWHYLYEVLHLTAPYRDYLRGKPQLLRHLESIYYHYQMNRSKLTDINILGAMAKAFPGDPSPLYEKKRKPGRGRRVVPTHLPPLPDELVAPTQIPHRATRHSTYTLAQSLQDLEGQKLLSFGDLHESVAVIGASAAQIEAAWQTKLGLMSKAFKVNLTGDYGPHLTQTHTEKTERPYDLIVVPKHKLNPEHYIFSTFGVLAISPGLGTEVMSLADWQREAMLWCALTHIPFFRNYLLQKTFTSWYREVRRLWMLRHRKLLLIQELRRVHWLPLDVTEPYTLDEFLQHHSHRTIEACNSLKKFFNYCNIILQM
ncbi:hypothetical protein chiPu_0021767, partial [Chiloscyllium punctatum]|nr:hypothetical protein [Chiloscyllium punctatum]